MEKIHTFILIPEERFYLGKSLKDYLLDHYPKAKFVKSFKDFLGILEKKSFNRKDFCCYLHGYYPSLKLKIEKNVLYTTSQKSIFHSPGFILPIEKILKKPSLKDFTKIIEVENIHLDEQPDKIFSYWKSSFYKKLKKRGVIFLDEASTFIDHTCTFHGPVTIHPHVQIKNHSIIKKNSIIESYNHLDNVQLGSDSLVKSFSYLKNSSFKKGNILGPFCHTEDTKMGSHNILGNFVELVRTQGKNFNKIKHHTYLGDTSLGSNNNIGAGTITCNFDGSKKHKTIIQNKTFIGANTNLIAPMIVENKAKTGAGSTLSGKISRKTLALTRNPRIDKKY